VKAPGVTCDPTTELRRAGYTPLPVQKGDLVLVRHASSIPPIRSVELCGHPGLKSSAWLACWTTTAACCLLPAACLQVHGNVDHLSLSNTSPRSRHTFQLHLVEDNPSTARWRTSNWQQYDPFPRLVRCQHAELESKSK
jgi:hypothetical protein